MFDDVFCKKGGRAREKITVGTCIAGDTFAPFCQRFYLRTCVVASIFFGAAGLEASFRIHTAIHVTLQNKTSISHVVPIISYHSAESDTTTRAASDDQGPSASIAETRHYGSFCNIIPMCHYQSLEVSKLAEIQPLAGHNFSGARHLP